MIFVYRYASDQSLTSMGIFFHMNPVQIDNTTNKKSNHSKYLCTLHWIYYAIALSGGPYYHWQVDVVLGCDYDKQWDLVGTLWTTTCNCDQISVNQELLRQYDMLIVTSRKSFGHLYRSRNESNPPMFDTFQHCYCKHSIHYFRSFLLASWWHEMETFSALLVFVRRIHRSLVNSPHKSQWRGALRVSSICAWINSRVNTREAGILRRHSTYYDAIVMPIFNLYR